MQVEQLAVAQAVERAAREAAGQHGAADVAGAMIDPGLQEGGADLGALPAAAGRAEAARRPVTHARGRSAPVITTPASPNSSGSSPGRKRSPKISMPPMPMTPSTTRTGRSTRASVDGLARRNQKMAKRHDRQRNEGQKDDRHGSLPRRRRRGLGRRNGGASRAPPTASGAAVPGARAGSAASARRCGCARRRLAAKAWPPWPSATK